MRQPLVAGNWKMNGSTASARELLAGIKAGAAGVAKCEVAVCPPYVYLPLAREELVNTWIAWGAQNLSTEAVGAFTGEISAAMLLDLGCTYVIVGHSERRAIYGETDALVAARYAKAIAHGVTPILCVGETLEEREANQTFAVIDAQLGAVLDLCGVESLLNAVIAYEPVWAIGTGRTASTEQAQEVHAYIRGEIAKRNADVAAKVQILYGGSVKPDNAPALFGQPDVDGGLIGGASLDAKSFLAICLAA